MSKQQIKEKLQAVKEKFQQKKKLLIALIALVVIFLGAIILLGIFSAPQEETEANATLMLQGKPQQDNKQEQAATQGESEAQQSMTASGVADIEVKPLVIPENASQKDLEVMAEDLMLELEKLQQQQEDVVEQMDEVEQKLKQSLEKISRKQSELEKLKSQQ